ncbi:MAG: glycosyltransferase [bacterium]
MRVGIGFTFPGSIHFEGKEIYPLRIAGDTLQAYWLIKHLMDDVSFSSVSENNDINHLFYFDFSYFISSVDIKLGLTPNFFNFLYYNLFVSASYFTRFFSRYFTGLAFLLKKLKFFFKNYDAIKNFSRWFIEKQKIKYVIFSSEWEKSQFVTFLKDLGIHVERLNLIVMDNFIDFEEIDYALDVSWSYLKIIKDLPKEYILILSRFDRVKNIHPFIISYYRNRINRDLPVVIVGTIQDYDVDYYKTLKSFEGKEVKIINVNSFLDFVEDSRKRYLVTRAISLGLIKSCYVVTIPSLVESFGYVGIEGLYLGKPVVVTQNSPYPEILGQYVNKSLKLIDPLRLDLNYDLFCFSEYIYIGDYLRQRFDAKQICKKYLKIWQDCR